MVRKASFSVFKCLLIAAPSKMLSTFLFCRKYLEYFQNTELQKSDSMPAVANVL